MKEEILNSPNSSRGRDNVISSGYDREKTTVEAQLQQQLQQKGHVNHLADFIGILAEEGQSLEEDLKLLTR